VFGWLYTQSTSGKEVEILFYILAAVFKLPDWFMYIPAGG